MSIFFAVIVLMNLLLGGAFALSLQDLVAGDAHEMAVWAGFAAAVFCLDFLYGEHLKAQKEELKKHQVKND